MSPTELYYESLGRNARSCDRPLLSNPYRRDSPEWNAWRLGWLNEDWNVRDPGRQIPWKELH